KMGNRCAQDNRDYDRGENCKRVGLPSPRLRQVPLQKPRWLYCVTSCHGFITTCASPLGLDWAGRFQPSPMRANLLCPKLRLQRGIVHVLLRVDRALDQDVLELFASCELGQIFDGLLTHSLHVKECVCIEVLLAKQLEPDWEHIDADEIHVRRIGEGMPLIGVL